MQEVQGCVLITFFGLSCLQSPGFLQGRALRGFSGLSSELHEVVIDTEISVSLCGGGGGGYLKGSVTGFSRGFRG